MRRTVVALLFVFACLCAGSTRAEDIRFPKQGSPAFMISLPSGWTGHEDQYNGIQLLPADHRTLVYLSLVRDPQYKDKPLMDLALAIGKPSNISTFPKQEPASISGRNGTRAAMCPSVSTTAGRHCFCQADQSFRFEPLNRYRGTCCEAT